MKYYIGIDLGGTFIKAGVVDEAFNIIAKASLPTILDTADALADQIAKTALLAMEDAKLTIDQIEADFRSADPLGLEGVMLVHNLYVPFPFF